MKTEMREKAQKAAYAVVGAPVVAGKKIAGYTGKIGKTAQKEFENWVSEGERMTAQVREGKVVTEIKERVDFEQLQGRVEKLRDQLEDVLAGWRESFKPEGDEEAPAVEEQATAVKPKKVPAAKKAPAAKKTAKAKTTKKAEAKDKS